MTHSCCQDSSTYQSAWMSFIPAQVTSLITKTLSQREPHCTDESGSETGNRSECDLCVTQEEHMHMLACKTKHRVHISPAPPAVPRSPSPHPPACKPSATTNRKPRGLTKQTGNSTSTEFLIMRICFAAGDH